MPQPRTRVVSFDFSISYFSCDNACGQKQTLFHHPYAKENIKLKKYKELNAVLVSDGIKVSLLDGERGQEVKFYTRDIILKVKMMGNG